MSEGSVKERRRGEKRVEPKFDREREMKRLTSSNRTILNLYNEAEGT